MLDLCRVIEGHGDRVAYTYFDKSRNLHDLTYGELGRLIKETAAGLDKIGLAGKRIAIIGETSVEWVASYMAILASGGGAIPMDKELEISQIGAFLEDVEATAIIYSASCRSSRRLSLCRGFFSVILITFSQSSSMSSSSK